MNLVQPMQQLVPQHSPAKVFGQRIFELYTAGFLELPSAEKVPDVFMSEPIKTGSDFKRSKVGDLAIELRRFVLS